MQMSETLIDDFCFELLVKGDYQSGLKLLREAFDAHAGGIMSSDNLVPKMLTGQGINPESLEVYNSHLSKNDYMNEFIFANTKDKVLVASNLVDFGKIKKTEYYQHVDKPSDICDKVGFHIVTPAEQFSVALYRDSKRDYTLSDYELARKLQPHVARCFRLLSRKTRTLEGVFSAGGGI